MIAYIVGNASGDKFRVMRNGCIDWTRDLTKALRFARREDAESFCDEGWTSMPIIGMDALFDVRAAILNACHLYWKAENTHGYWQQRRARQEAHQAQRRAEQMSFETLRMELMLRDPAGFATLTPPAKAQGLQS